MKDKKIHYGWIIVIACNILLAATIGIISNSSSLFIKPISDDLGVSRRAVSSTISLSCGRRHDNLTFCRQNFQRPQYHRNYESFGCNIDCFFFCKQFFQLHIPLLHHLCHKRRLPYTGYKYAYHLYFKQLV